MGKHKHHNKHDGCGCGGSCDDCRGKRRGHCDKTVRINDCYTPKRVEFKCCDPKFKCDYNNSEFGRCWQDTSCCRRYWNYEQPCYGCETKPIKCRERRHTKVICVCHKTPCKCRHW